MNPLVLYQRSIAKTFDPSVPAQEFREQWTHPTDVFSVLLLLGGDVVNRALGQLAGTGFTPVVFSFGWVAYAVSALVSSVGENKLMPEPDCAGLVINGAEGNKRDNTSWIIGRMIRDFWHWCPQQTKDELGRIIVEKQAELDKPFLEGKVDKAPPKVKQAGLCVTVFEASTRHKAGVPHIGWFSLGGDWLHKSGVFVTMFQLGVAAIPCGIFGDWSILMITAIGAALSFTFGSLVQWHAEKYGCRRETTKTVVLTRGNGAQHAIVILGKGVGLDLEDLAATANNVDIIASFWTRISIAIFSICWVLLLITAAGTRRNTWFLVAVGGIGILHNAAVAGWQRRPKHFGVPLEFREVIADKKVMQALYKLEERYPKVGSSVRDVFFQGKLFPKEQQEWRVFELEADSHFAGEKATTKEVDADNAEEHADDLEEAETVALKIIADMKDIGAAAATPRPDHALTVTARQRATDARAEATKARAKATAANRMATAERANLNRLRNSDPAPLNLHSGIYT